jgi:hypothetical protein
MNRFKIIVESVVVIFVATLLFVACEKDERPVFSTSSPVVLAENDAQFVGEDKTILINDTFQVSFTVTPGEGNILDEVVIERIKNGIKTNVAPDSQATGTTWRYIDEFIADGVTNEEVFRFTFIDTRENQYTKVFTIKTATILRDSSAVTFYTSAAKDSGFLNVIGYPIGWDLTNEKEVKYTSANGIGNGSPGTKADSALVDIISFEAPGSFNGGFTSLNGRLFATAPSTWKLDSITDRDCEDLYNTQLASLSASLTDSLRTVIPKSDSGDVFVTKMPGFINYVVIKITDVDKDFNPYTCQNSSQCYKGALSFKTIKKLTN